MFYILNRPLNWSLDQFSLKTHQKTLTILLSSVKSYPFNDIIAIICISFFQSQAVHCPFLELWLNPNMTNKELFGSFIKYLLSNYCAPESGSGKQFIVRSWRLDTVCDACYR